MRWLGAGPEARLLELSSAAEVTAAYAVVKDLDLSVRDVVPAARTILFDGVQHPDRLEDEVAAALDGGRGSDTTAAAGGEVEVPVRYDGEDLDLVARRWDMSRTEVVAVHTETEFVVAFCGFSPGFAYCTGLPEELHVPRRDTPRTKVPAGSVGLAGEFTAVYPTASPGGWQLLGVTALPLWDAEADPPARLAPGTRVRFTEVR